MTPAVTVIVPVKDRRDRMLACLEALLDQDHPSYEVLVADNGSSDGTAEACRERAQTAEVPVRVEVLQGTVGQVRNRAAALARGEVVAFMDSDCQAAPDWLSAGTRALLADPGLGVVCGATLRAEIPRRPWPKEIRVTAMSWRFESCNVFFRRRALLASDGFDEIVGDSWEDTAAGFSVLAGGWRPAFAADAVVYHDVTYPGFGWHLRRERRQANAARIVRRYPAARRVFYLGLFANARGAAQLLALATPALARRHRAAALLALPYAAHLARMVRPADMARLFLLDLELHAQFVRGALRERTLLL